jgi:hypothetical protein
MTIPMPGHLMSNAKEEEETKNKIIELTGLIEEHDVIFLGVFVILTVVFISHSVGLDSREARWLPTVIATLKNKVCSILVFACILLYEIFFALSFISLLSFFHHSQSSSLYLLVLNDRLSSMRR